MKRRNLIRNILLFIFTFIFGYTFKKEGESIVLQRVMDEDKNGKLSDDIKSIKGKLEETFAKVTDNAISPDDFKGSDYQKVQAAIIYAIKNKKSIRLARMYDITNNNPLYIDKPDDRWSLYFYGVGGGFIKTNTGYFFSTNYNYIGDLNYNCVKFESIAGSGAKIFNGNKIIRVFSLACVYRSIDTVASAKDSYLQSYRFNGDSIVGGKGNAIECAGAFDMVFTSVLVEHRENFFRQFKDTSSDYPSLYNVTFRDVSVEGLSGMAYFFCSVNLLTIDGGYYEKNGLGDIYFDPNGNYTLVSISNIRSQTEIGNPNKLSLIRWGGMVQEAKVFNLIGVSLPVNDTTSIKSGFITTENERQQGEGTVRNIDPNKRLIRYRSSKDYTNEKGVATTNLGMFKRIKRDYKSDINPNSYIMLTVTFPELIYTDDTVTVQMDKPDGQEIILCSYNKNKYNSSIEVWVKNNSNSVGAITLHVNVLKPFFSVSG